MSSSSPNNAPRKVPARYVGAHSVVLSSENGPYYDVNGQRLERLVLYPGDTLMVYAHEAYGRTYKWDPAGVAPLYDLGLGRVVLAEHSALDDAALAAEGYEFHASSPLFEPLQPLSSVRDQNAPDRQAIDALGGLTINDLRAIAEHEPEPGAEPVAAAVAAQPEGASVDAAPDAAALAAAIAAQAPEGATFDVAPQQSARAKKSASDPQQ